MAKFFVLLKKEIKDSLTVRHAEYIRKERLCEDQNNNCQRFR